MTRSIISLGKAAALDPCKELVSPVGSVGASKGRWPFEVAAGDPHLSALLLRASCPEWTARPASICIENQRTRQFSQLQISALVCLIC